MAGIPKRKRLPGANVRTVLAQKYRAQYEAFRDAWTQDAERSGHDASEVDRYLEKLGLTEKVRALEEGQAVAFHGWQLKPDLPNLNLDLDGQYVLTEDNRLTVGREGGA